MLCLSILKHIIVFDYIKILTAPFKIRSDLIYVEFPWQTECLGSKKLLLKACVDVYLS